MSKYYDLNDILVEDEVVSTVFHHKANGVGNLDPGSEDDNVEKGAVVELPLWLAQDLSRRKIIQVNLPPCFGAKVRKEVQADPACVNLRSKCPYFYEMGCKLADITGDPSLGGFLLSTLRGRYRDILCKALTSTITSTPKFMTLLTQEETHLFEAGRDSMRTFQKWRLQGPQLERAPILGRKRR
jgi:GINS complex subunit 3